ncbi:MAG: 3-dehydroquinate synthase [Chthoniobacterales bacterium]
MKSIEVRAGLRPYEVRIDRALLSQVGSLVKPHVSGPRCAVISDENVAPLYGKDVCARLRDAGFEPDLLTVPAGESSKSIKHAGSLCEQLSAAGLDRSSFLVALGGGMVGDLTGFVASIYLRGIPYLSLPTTLLAQLDSCLGGKTGVNSSQGKNLIGTFLHPMLVLADTETLRSLPERIWNEGFAEAIKHGVIRDAGLFRALASVERENCVEFVASNLRVKAALVEADEREENGLRQLLNFGHTVGHAIEHAAGYGNMLHGEAISLGLLAAAHVSVHRAGLSSGEVEEIREALIAHHLPVTLPADFPRENIFPALSRDKKIQQGRLGFVVAHEIGRASISHEVTIEDIRAAVDRL